ncbi:TRCF domain-containing protein [Methylobacterium persicinum]
MEAKGQPAEDWTPEIGLGLAATIPDSYVPEPEIRLDLYTRVLRLREAEAIEALAAEVEDRFGAPPEPVAALFALGRLRAACRQLGIARLNGGPQGIAADFRAGRRPGPMAAADDLVFKENRVVLRRPTDDAAARADLAADLLERIREARERSR